MPPRKNKPNGAAMQSKPSPDELRMLIDDYDIEFLGPGHRWPDGYTNILKKIKAISRETYASHQPQRDGDVLTIAQTRGRVDKIIRAARQDYKDRVNEITWRLHTEQDVFNRFRSEIKCRKCKNQLWVSKYTAESAVPELTEMLQHHRSQAVVCCCSSTTRAEDNFVDTGDVHIFSDVCDRYVEPDPEDKLDEHNVTGYKPDRVFGLRMTESFKHYTRHRSDIRHSPFIGRWNTLYPFLVSEAKSESGSPGFESIEAQTAFPLFSCVRLQQRLSERTGVELQPLVWFMPFFGDVWKVSACIVHADKIQVHDLWSGSVRDPDGALQLLHIVDYIVDWARNIYRKNILACLAGSWNDVRRLTPAASVVGRMSTADRESSQRFSPPIPSIEEGDQDFDVEMNEVYPHEDTREAERQNVPAMEEDSVRTHPFLRWVDSAPGRPLWSNTATIRHANMIRFKFEHLVVPEDPNELSQNLRFLSHKMRLGQESETDLAEKVSNWLYASNRSQTWLSVSTHQILSTRSDWLKSGDFRSTHLDDDEENMQALFVLDTKFDPSEWHVVRTLRCFTYTTKARESLAKLARLRPSPWQNLDLQSFSKFEDVQRVLADYRCLTGQLSALVAVESAALTVQLHPAVKLARVNQNTDELLAHLAPLSRATTCVDSPLTNGPLEVMDRRIPPELIRHIARNMMALKDGILLKKNPGWPASTPKWCLVILEEADFSNEVFLAEALLNARRKGHIFQAAQESNPRNRSLSPLALNDQDELFLDSWTNSMKSAHRDLGM